MPNGRTLENPHYPYTNWWWLSALHRFAEQPAAGLSVRDPRRLQRRPHDEDVWNIADF